MNWPQIIEDLLESGMTGLAIAEVIGSTPSYVTEVKNRQIKRVSWDRGEALLRLHAEHCVNKAA